MTEPRFGLGETVQVYLPDGIRIGVIRATEPGENLRLPIAETAYHVRIPGHDALSWRVVIVGEANLGKLTED